MTYATVQGEVGTLNEIWQRPHGGVYLSGPVIGQADAADTQAGPPQSLSWASQFNLQYRDLRQIVTGESFGLIDGTSAAQGAFDSIQNALVHCDNVAAAIVAGDTSQSSKLLNIMGNLIQVLRPEVRPSLLSRLEAILRGVPKNLTDVVAFVAEQANQAAAAAVGGTAGKVIIGLGLAGLVGLYLWKK